MVRRFTRFLFVLALAVPSLAADTQTPPAFSTSTGFVQVPVIVQRSGRHVAGLKKENFVLRQDGREQPIASFQEIHADETAQGVAESQFGNHAGQIPPQITIIALDMVNTPNLDRAYFMQEFERFLSKSGKFEGPIGVVAIERTGIRLLRGFTTDPAAILSAVGKNSTAQPTANNQGTEFTRQISDQDLASAELFGSDVAQSLEARKADEAMIRFQDRSSRIDVELTIQQLAQALKGIPGRKSLLLVGSGFKFIDSTTVMRTIGQGYGGTEINYSVENAGETLNQALYTWRLLNDANVAVYPIDTRRTVNTAFQTMDTSGANTPSDLTFRQNQQADQDILATFKTISAATGGKACFYRTDLDNCVREAIEDDHDYYLLGFYVDKKNQQPGWHKIEVKTEEKASIRYRQGFMLAKFNSEAARKSDVGLALNSPFAYTDLPFTGKFESFMDRGKNKLAKFRLQIPPDAITVEDASGHIDFQVVGIARAQGGKEAAHFLQRIDRKFPPENIAEIKRVGIDYGNQLELPSGEYGVWFVVRDNLSGRTGSAVVPIKVP